MISHISIKNFAIIENTEFSLHPGFNVLTGETGAGKSIVIEAISLALGARADSGMVRTGAEKAIIQLVGEIDGEETVIKREISAAGKNLCKMNGEIVTLGELAAHCKRLADIHGQYDHQSLINNDYHLSLIDLYGNKHIDPLKKKVADAYSRYTACKKELDELRSADAERLRKRDFMRFECEEIEKAAPRLGEDEELKEHITLMQNSEKIYAVFSEACEIASESDNSAMSALSYIMRQCESLADINADFRALSEELSDIYYRFEDVAHTIRAHRDATAFSPEELDAALARLDLLDTLKRKYGGSIPAVLEYSENASRELTAMDNIDARTDELESELETVTRELTVLSDELSALRKNIANDLCTKIARELQELSFNNAELEVAFGRISEPFSSTGTDTAHFLISTNVGEPLKPLAKIASGGEMSRIMLAFKKITADFEDIPTMIFDEIDSGISGIAAGIVGQKLREISEQHQIVCITHLPQIAACGDYNYKIDKESDGKTTRTTIIPLTQEEKIDEVARLLGGTVITETTRKSAAELIAASVR